MAKRRWFDGHLDLACLAVQGRDMSKSLAECGAAGPAAVTFPALTAGNVQGVLATIFVQKRIGEAESKRRGQEHIEGPWFYDTAEEAYAAGKRQLEWYRGIQNSGIGIQNLVLMIEGADCLRTVADFAEYYQAGVRVVSLAWAEGSKWSGGNTRGGGITAAGWELVAELDRRGVIHDVSHLSEKAFWELMGRDGKGSKNLKVATHSNPRAMLPGKQHLERNLSDEQIRALVAQGGIIGLVLFKWFLINGPDVTKERRATIADVLRHIAYYEDLTGRRDFLALGSDMDGGFDATQLPVGLDSADKIDALGDALAGAGWSETEIERFAWGNWARVLGLNEKPQMNTEEHR